VSTADIDERLESPISLMPQGLTDVLTREQFTDLVAYLETLRSAGKPTPGAAIAGPIKLPAGFQVRTIATGLTGATALEAACEGRFFICEQAGALRIVKNGRLLEKPLIQHSVDSHWERGLIGVTVDPEFPQAPYIYVC